MSGYVLSGDADADLQDIFSFGIVTWGEKRATKYIYDMYEKLDLVGFNATLAGHVLNFIHSAELCLTARTCCSSCLGAVAPLSSASFTGPPTTKGRSKDMIPWRQ